METEGCRFRMSYSACTSKFRYICDLGGMSKTCVRVHDSSGARIENHGTRPELGPPTY